MRNMSNPGSITAAARADTGPSYMPSINTGTLGGGTYTADSVQPTLEAYENIFGPSARDIKVDLQRFKRHGRWHLPDVLKGPNQYLTDRIDGLITDHTNSPFTSRILPYKYITNVDGKIKWNVWSFDEGLASRVPYESAARTLQQSKRSFAGYAVRQGMAIVLEHNFMMSEPGRQNFKNQLNQLVGSIQMTNDLDVHTALVLAPSYERTMREKYMGNDKSPSQICREYVDLFGFMQKNVNALDILIEEAKTQLRMWGSPMPDFLLCNSKITFNLQMTPDRTNYVTQGEEGQKRLRAGPNIDSYRGISIIPSRSFSMETGAPPRDMLRRRVRVAEYYRIPPHEDNAQRMFALYNEERDTWFQMSFKDLLVKAKINNPTTNMDPALPGANNFNMIKKCITEAVLSSAGRGRPSLGAPISEADITASYQTANVETFLKLLAEGSLLDQITQKADLLWNNIVYVPGAADPMSRQPYKDEWDPSDLDGQPQYIQVALRDTLTPGTKLSHAQFMMDSLANYPRKISTFFTLVKNDSTVPCPTGSGDANMKTQLETLVGGSKANLVADARIRALRNWNRYAIPSEGMITGVNYKDACKTNVSKFKTTFEKEPFTSQNTIMSEYLSENSILRVDRGAFFSPNFYSQSGLQNMSFNSLGNELGRNILLTEELINMFTKVKVANVATFDEIQEQYKNSLLYDALKGVGKGPELVQKVQKAVKDNLTKLLNLNLSKTNTRAGITGVLHADLQTISLTDYNRKGFNETYSHFWTWPETVNDIHTHGKGDYTSIKHCITALPPGGSGSVANIDDVVQFNKAQLESLVRWNTEPHNNGNEFLYLCTPLSTMLDSAKDFTEDDARAFLCMIAWRLWGDQLVPLHEIDPAHGYDRGGMWTPDITHYLSPTLYYQATFGGARMDPNNVRIVGSGGRSVSSANMEVVMVRPNIEHFMFGIILGQGGEGLGSTFWGQTELSCYDDSQHGIWGMSYKYHERAMVINERNLVRLWDVGYDGYVGGKDDKCVEWNDADKMDRFRQETVDVTRPYRGDSIMVMAFDHTDKMVSSFQSMYEKGFKSNWPSPIVFEDRDPDKDEPFTVDYENINLINRKEFRVFNTDVYKNAYKEYLQRMPHFNELHRLRKNAGQASMEGETSSDSLAFQGTLQVFDTKGNMISQTLGSGHHGPDFVGVASLRAGKGYKISGQPTVQRLV